MWTSIDDVDGCPDGGCPELRFQLPTVAHAFCTINYRAVKSLDHAILFGLVRNDLSMYDSKFCEESLTIFRYEFSSIVALETFD